MNSVYKLKSKAVKWAPRGWSVLSCASSGLAPRKIILALFLTPWSKSSIILIQMHESHRQQSPTQHCQCGVTNNNEDSDATKLDKGKRWSWSSKLSAINPMCTWLVLFKTFISEMDLLEPTPLFISYSIHFRNNDATWKVSIQRRVPAWNFSLSMMVTPCENLSSRSCRVMYCSSVVKHQ